MLKKEIKENKYTMFVFFAFLILFILGWVLFGLFMPKTGTPVYGDRLKGIEKVQLTEENVNSLVKELERFSYVTKAEVDEKGATINVIITVKDKTETKTAKALDENVLKPLTKEQKEFYDIQLFIKNENEKASGYPIIGYKNSTAKGFTY